MEDADAEYVRTSIAPRYTSCREGYAQPATAVTAAESDVPAATRAHLASITSPSVHSATQNRWDDLAAAEAEALAPILHSAPPFPSNQTMRWFCLGSGATFSALRRRKSCPRTMW
ncbi:hypothetical protein MPH_13616, partial [Macrophomina phaseolina MS6]